MRLKSLKLAGFKSFANPTTFTFKHDITAIVGPNGCGKSNVIDAIRWVLGEMSAKQLRGGAMSDVIFSGVEGRAAKSLASVELVFEHTQDEVMGIRHALNLYHELSLRRQVTRDGKSDYFINGQRVRRRDVVDVFLGTGLSSRSYAVIEQGMIGKIIDADGVRLREFVEEAAGVSRYQVRRMETQKQLADAQDNLTRLDDLQAELVKQQKTLERQAKSAKRYQEISEELHQIEGELLVHQLYAIASQLHNQSIEKTKAETALTEANSHLLAVRKQFDEASARLAETTFLKDNAKDAYHNALLAKNSSEHALNAQKAKQNQLEDELAHHHDERLAYQNNCQNATQNIKTLEEELKADEPKLAELNNTLNQDSQNVRQAYDAWQQAKRELGAVFDQKNALNSTKNVHASQLVRATQTQQKWTRKHEQFVQQYQGYLTDGQGQANARHELDELKHTANQLQSNIAKIDSQLEYLQEEYDTHAPQLATLNATLATQKEAILTAEKQHAIRLAEYNTLHALVHPPKQNQPNTQTASDEVAQMLSGLVSLKNQIHLNDKAKPYLAVLDAYFANYLEDKVVRPNEWQMLMAQLANDSTNAHTNKAVNGVWCMADKSHHSPANVSNLSNVPLSNHASNHVVWLSSLIDTQALPLWQDVGLLADGQMVQGEALQAFFDELPHARLLTQTGWLIGKGYAVSLVKSDEGIASGYLAQKQQHETRLDELEEELGELEDTLEQNQKIHRHTQSQTEEKRVVLEEISSKIKQLEKNMQTHKHELTRTHASIDAGQIKSQNAAARMAELTQEKAELDAELATLTAQKQEIDTNSETIERELSWHKERNHELMNAHTNADNAYKAKQRTAEQLGIQINLAKERLTHANAMLNQNQTALNQLLARQNTQEASLLSIQNELPNLTEQYQRTESDCHTAKIALDEYEQILQNQQADQLQRQQQLTQAHTDIATHQSMVSTLTANVEASEERLAEMGTVLNAHTPTNIASLLHDFAKPNYQLATPRHSLTQKQSELMAEQGKLGAVNLAAAAELNEVNARLSPMDVQIVDIKASIEALQTAITTIDEKTKTLFLDTLSAVNEELNALFTKVFGGGQASLSLSDDEDLPKSEKWRAGLVLMAQPKGKKNSRLAVLSGGEKTLTALSLIFAIFKQHPAPFCVLDEVDAPLDDANVGRFTSLIHELASSVQFIFISHNKLAMQTADELKGITMPTAGISSLVAVNLEDVDQYLEAGTE